MQFRRPLLALSSTLLAAALAVRAAPAPAQALMPEAQEYRTLSPPQPTSSPGKIEVVEFFSYGCPHCNEFYPLVNSWARKLPKDVVFKRVPVGFNRPNWVNLARAYYALEASGDLAKLDGALFHAIHEEKLPLFDEPTLADWVGKHGGDAERFAAAYASFGVNNLTVQADRMAENYRVEGIPALAINGQYVAQGATFAEILEHADHAIARVRAAGAAPAPAAKDP
jgi:thiol:disulfide interchange protein DsbA